MEKIKLLFIIVLLLLNGTVYSQTPAFGSVSQFGGTSNSYGFAIDADPTGNIYSTGNFSGTTDFDPGPGVVNFTSGSIQNIFVVKINPSGGLAWARHFNGTGASNGLGIEVNSVGAVVITGYFAGTVDFDPGVGVFNLTSGGSSDIFVCKLDASGNLVWAKQMGGTGIQQPSSMALDASDNIYTTGVLYLTGDFDPGPGIFNMTSSNADDIFVSKLDTDGNFVYAKKMGGTSINKGGKSIDVDASGNVIIIGRFQGTVDFDPGPGIFNLVRPAGGMTTPSFICKLDASGNFVWANIWQASTSNERKALITDASGNIFIAGYFAFATDIDPGAGVLNLTPGGNNDMMVMKLDTNGDLIWVSQMVGTTTGQSLAESIDLDQFGNIYSIGQLIGTVDFDPGVGTKNLTSTGATFLDFFISKLDPSGNFVWAGKIGGPNTDNGVAIVVGPDQNVYTTGNFAITCDFDPSPCVVELSPITSGRTDAFISKTIQIIQLQPTISGFSPISGPIGTSVTISGLEFDPIAANNIVRFNGVNATVNASTSTSITTIVPAGATSGVISVTIGCNSVLSSTDFIIGATSCIPASERNALIALYNSTNGAAWTNNTNWLSADESTWYGVTLTGCNVTSINLNANNLIGTLPTEIENLTELFTLSIGRDLASETPNQITGTIPNSITALTKLASLNLRDNLLTGSLPAQIGNLSSLALLDVRGNQLSGNLPASLYTLTNLSQLYLWFNQFTGSISPAIGNLTNLEGLYISTNQFSGSIPNEIGNLNKIVALYLANNQFSGSLPASLGNLVNLTEFSVFNNQLTGDVPTSFSNLTNLQVLGLSRNQFVGDLPIGIGALSNLFDIALRDNDFTSVPVFTSTSIIGLTVYGNKLHFGHLEPNISKTGFVYSPQDNLPGGSLTACEGGTLTINFSTPGSANQYQWYKDGTPITGANSANFSKPNATTSDAGNYTVEVTNTIVMGLTLTSDPFIISIEQSPCSNQPPVIASIASGAQIEGMVTIDLLPLISDPDGNLDLSTLRVVGSTSEEGASASINASSELILDYSGVLFTGIDHVTIEVCDLFGVCVQQELEIEVVGDIVVFNALSPNPGDNLNSVFIIQYIDVLPDTEKNRVNIYNRWGDVVWEGMDYDNSTIVFNGTSNDGKELPSGTYFYKIEFTGGRESKTGYLSLKR